MGMWNGIHFINIGYNDYGNVDMMDRKERRYAWKYFWREEMRIVMTNARMIIYDDRTLTWISDDWIFIILLFCL